MEASVRRAKNLGDIYLLELDPAGISTFDFERAQEILSGKNTSPYENVRHRTRDVLDEVHDATGTRVSSARWEFVDNATSMQLYAVYKEQQSKRPFRQHLRRITIIANSLLEEGEEDFGTKDVMIQELVFSPTQFPIDCLLSGIYVNLGQKPSNVYLEIRDAEQREVNFLTIPLAILEEKREIYALQNSFIPPLEPPDPPTQEHRHFLRTEFRLDRAFPDLLGAKRKDYLESNITRVDGTCQRVEFEVHIPKSFGQVPFSESAVTTQEVQCRPLPSKQSNLRRRKGHFDVVVWAADDVPNESLVSLELRR